MIIGVNGLKGSGKDTVGKYLVENHGFEQASFARKLKQSASALFGVDIEKWEDWKNDPHMIVAVYKSKENQMWELDADGPFVGMTVRRFLQNYGTESHRDIFGYDFWVEYALKDIDTTKNYVFTDARFENELKAIKDMGGYNIQVLRSSTEGTDDHPSEIVPPVDLIDFAVFNEFDFDFLYKEIEFCLDRIEEEVHGVKH